jgi:hypothetical protein
MTEAAHDVIARAIMMALTEGPPAPAGTNWPYHTMDPAEARQRALAVLQRLDEAGYVVVRKEADRHR